VLRELRLQRAQSLIAQSPRLHVGALAWRCGFAGPSDFSKLFRARFGLSPTEWHQRARPAGA
jgi:transcriptional regulator GlxA family with amidase domain